MRLKVITIFSLLILSCDKQYKVKIIEKWTNGQKKVVHLYTNKYDSTNFIKECYFENGQMEYRGRLKNKLQEGHWLWWYKNGNKKDEATYKKGRYIKTRTHWNEDGLLCYRLYFPNN